MGKRNFHWFNRVFLMFKYFGSIMAQQNEGVILNIASDLSVIARVKICMDHQILTIINICKTCHLFCDKNRFNWFNKISCIILGKEQFKSKCIISRWYFDNQSNEFLKKISKILDVWQTKMNIEKPFYFYVRMLQVI